MRPIRFSSERLEALFQDATVATLPQLKAALGTTVDLTVFRKLSALPYRTSYSHRGAYYTLDPLAQYDDWGLWSYRDIYFSRHGTLLDTAATLVTQAPAGYFTDELEAVVHVAAKDALRQLAQQGRLYRRDAKAAIFIVPASAGFTSRHPGALFGQCVLLRIGAPWRELLWIERKHRALTGFCRS